jgi:hypothetical protein
MAIPANRLVIGTFGCGSCDEFEKVGLRNSVVPGFEILKHLNIEQGTRIYEL